MNCADFGVEELQKGRELFIGKVIVHAGKRVLKESS